MLLAAITNSWKRQLETTRLVVLAQDAAERGARHIELRQGSLGECERHEGSQWRPVLSACQALVEATPGISYNLAIALPCLTQRVDPQGELFQSALAGAITVNPRVPHLRLVDHGSRVRRSLMKRIKSKLRKSLNRVPIESTWQTVADLPESALAIIDLAREAASQGVILSIENSIHPIHSLELLVNTVRKDLATEQQAMLGLCLDVLNQRIRFPHTNAEDDLASLTVDMIRIVHFRQARNGVTQSILADGDLDNHAIVRMLNKKGYNGPLVVETPPHPKAMDNLSASFAYLSEA